MTLLRLPVASLLFAAVLTAAPPLGSKDQPLPPPLGAPDR